MHNECVAVSTFALPLQAEEREKRKTNTTSTRKKTATKTTTTKKKKKKTKEKTRKKNSLRNKEVAVRKMLEKMKVDASVPQLRRCIIQIM